MRLRTFFKTFGRAGVQVGGRVVVASRWASGQVRFRDKRFDEFVVFGWLWCVGNAIIFLSIFDCCLEKIGWKKK